MKTLAFLSALAAVAIAAPALPDDRFEEFQKIITKLPEHLKQEKRSPQASSTTDFHHTPGAPVNLPSLPQINDFGHAGRSIAVKKPIIVKRKQGFHVYRDSDEEPVESRESCGKQVKVKLCDVKSAEMKSSVIEDFNLMTEDEIKHNIKLAKEAVENLQRDLSKIEKGSDTKAAAWKNGHLESDAELHQDIEVARDALDHILNNFGNLESMNLETTTLKDSDLVQNHDSAMSKTDEQRLAQWKEAMDSIQKNIEIAKNIENSFIAASSDKVMNMEDSNKKGDQGMRINENMNTKNVNIELMDKSLQRKSSEMANMESGSAKREMESSASTISETQMKNSHDMHGAKTMSEISSLNQDQGENHQLRNADMDTIKLDHDPQIVHKLSSDSLRTIDEGKEKNEPRKLKLTEHTSMDDVSSTKMKSSSNSEAESHMTTNVVKDSTDDKHHMNMKTAESLGAMQNNKQTNMKQEHTNTEHSDHSLSKAKLVHNNDNKENEQTIPSTDLEKPSHHHHLNSFLHPEMRSSDDMKNMHNLNPEQRQWHEDNQSNLRMDSMNADSIPSQTMDVVEINQIPSHHLHHAMNSHHFNSPQHARYHDFMMQGKASNNMDMPTYMRMRDGSNMVQDNRRFPWESTHDAMRVAYGSSAPAASVAASSGSNYPNAVFPDANLGNCAVPLLLSCNPSVVSGIMAKSKPAYTSSTAYRSEDDFNFHTKRDASKAHESTALLKKPQNHNHKTSTVLVAKQ